MQTPGQWLKDYFDLNRGERRGIAALLVIILAISVFSYCIPYIFKPRQEDFSEIQKLSARLQEIQIEKRDTAEKMFLFDPNTISRDNLLKLGLKSRVASMIINYRNRGEKFIVKEDLLKIQGISKDAYLQLAPWVKIGK